jgi:methionyl-tRNA formyltransferase
MESSNNVLAFDHSMKHLRLVFMGTPEFAVASLDALVQAGCQIVAVVTAPDKPAGRGMKIQQSAVKKYATEQGLKVMQPEKLKNQGFLQELQSLKPDIQVVVAFRMLPEVLWNMPPMGTINLHGSLLPQYRGAAPINWAVINGERKTGVTTFKLRQEIDTGDILLQESFPISQEDTAGDVHERMKNIGAQLLVQTIKGLAEGNLRETPQAAWMERLGETALPLRHAPKITTEICRIDWNRPVDEIQNLIRGLSPLPGAFTELHGKVLKIFHSHKEKLRQEEHLGQAYSDGKTFLKFAAADGYIYADEIQLEGRKKMTTGEFMRGYRFESNGSGT